MRVCTAVGLMLVVALFAGCREKPAAPSKKKEEKQPSEAKKTETTERAKKPGLIPTWASLDEASQTRATQLYQRHCAGCHGEKGDGRGVADPYLFPKPRNFQAGRFRLVSTQNGVPTLQDLDRVLKRGMPGSSMPPWPKLSEEDRRLLAIRVMAFRREALREQERKAAAEFGEEVDPQKIEETVQALTTPGPPVEVPALSEPTEETIARGRELYLKRGCAGCHGKEGRGDGQEKMVDARGLPTRPRDLTKGIYKGEPDPVSVYIRTQAGMPGTPMPADPKLTPEEVEALVHFVLSLSDAQTRAATVLNRAQIVARWRKVLPETADAAEWANIDPVQVRLTPLWWRDQFTPHVEVQAAHDGTRIAVRLSWEDATADQTALRTEAFRDAVALALSAGPDEPFLGMGGGDSAVEVWMWDADRQTRPDIAQAYPRVVVDRYPFAENAVETGSYDREGTRSEAQPPISLPALAVGNPIVPRQAQSGGSLLEAAGPGTVTFRPPVNQDVVANGSWKDGRWQVVMIRPLRSESGLVLEPGQRVSATLAVWDGSRRDRDGQKLISIWQDLLLEKPEG